MSTKKISELNSADNLDPTSIFPVVSEGTTKKVSLEILSNTIIETAKNEINQLGFIKSEIENFTGATRISNIVSISQTEYDNIQSKDPNTLYIVRPS